MLRRSDLSDWKDFIVGPVTDRLLIVYGFCP